ncbi:MAG: CapA family protein [Lachnospiraceae bacterium]|nr:CapA family protein [Lachnospiraceae bacterium]
MNKQKKNQTSSPRLLSRYTGRHFLLLTGLIILLFTGCAGATSKPTKATQSKASQEASASEAAPSEEDMIVINTSPSKEESSANEIVEEIDTREYFEGYPLSEEDVSENWVYRKNVKKPGEATIVFAGDINFDDRYANMSSLRSRGGGISSSIGASLINRMKDADICMINNEFPYSNRGTPTAGKKYTFRARPETVNMMVDMGVDIVSLANNHAYDHGKEALLDTFDTLDSVGIHFVGAGHNLDEAKKPVYFIAGGMKIAFVSATQIERSLPPDTKEATETEPGVLRTLDPAKFLEVIRTAKEHSDFVIVYVHWGTESVNQYEASQHDLAAQYVEAGADLIMGDHPHVLQGFEHINGVPILYSLGNYWFNSRPLDTCLVEATLKEGSLASLRFIPCRQQGCRTTEVDAGSSEFKRILKNMRSWSKNTDINSDGLVAVAGTFGDVKDEPAEEETPEAEASPAQETPTPAEAPAQTETPAPGETPAPAEAPAQTDTPAQTESPTPAEAPAQTETPALEATPAQPEAPIQ